VRLSMSSTRLGSSDGELGHFECEREHSSAHAVRVAIVASEPMFEGGIERSLRRQSCSRPSMLVSYMELTGPF